MAYKDPSTRPKKSDLDKERLQRETVNDIEMPENFLRSGNRIMLWRALAAGERIHKHMAAHRFGLGVDTAGRIIFGLHRAGKAHIVGWTRNGDRGGFTMVIAFGPGEDLPKPARLSNAFVCLRWRDKHKEQVRLCDRNARLKRKLREGKVPTGNDPLLMAIMGLPYEGEL